MDAAIQQFSMRGGKYKNWTFKNRGDMYSSCQDKIILPNDNLSVFDQEVLGRTISTLLLCNFVLTLIVSLVSFIKFSIRESRNFGFLCDWTMNCNPWTPPWRQTPLNTIYPSCSLVRRTLKHVSLISCEYSCNNMLLRVESSPIWNKIIMQDDLWMAFSIE